MVPFFFSLALCLVCLQVILDRLNTILGNDLNLN
jgi:hypothetical protein